MNTRFWMKKDVDQEPGIHFPRTIQKKAKDRLSFRIWRALWVDGSEKATIVSNRFTLIVLSALRRSDTENRQVGPHGSGGSSKDGDGDTSFQWSQFTTQCSYLMLPNQEEPTELVEDFSSGEKGKKEISTTNISVSTAGVSTTEAVLSTVIPEINTARQEQEKSDLEKALELQKQLDEREEVVAEADPTQLNIEALQVKNTIIDWEVFTEESRSYWRIIRVGNHTEVYHVFEDMSKRFDRDDLEKIWDLVKKKFCSTEPIIDKEKVLWVELKRLFEPDDDDTLWKRQRYMHDPLK
ncbi:hypothetical protein Tco_0647106 [Tanacetum coccineum]